MDMVAFPESSEASSRSVDWLLACFTRACVGVRELELEDLDVQRETDNQGTAQSHFV